MLTRYFDIDSKNRFKNSTVYPYNTSSGTTSSTRFTINMPFSIGKACCYFAVLFADVPNTAYQIRSPHNTLTVTENVGAPFTITITPGNYNVTTFITEFQTQMNAGSPNLRTYTMTYNSTTGKFTITTSAGTFLLNFSTSDIFYRYLGGAYDSGGVGVDTTTSASWTSVNVINLNPWNYYYIKSDVIASSIITPDSLGINASSNSNANPADINLIAKYTVHENFGTRMRYAKFTEDFQLIKINNMQSIDFYLTWENNELMDLNGHEWDIAFAFLEIPEDDKNYPRSLY